MSMNYESAKTHMHAWQDFLRLNQWRIQFIFEPTLPLNIRGRVYWEGQYGDATILINSSYPWEKDNPMEKTILHELLHLKFAELGDPPPDDVEDTVRRLTTLIYDKMKIRV